MNGQLSIRRIAYLIKKELREKRGILLGMLAFVFIIQTLNVVADLLTDLFADNTQGIHIGIGSNFAGFLKLYVFCGLILSSLAFGDLKRAASAQAYIVLPASAGEKYIAKLVVYWAGWTVACFLSGYFLVAVIERLLLAVIIGPAAESFMLANWHNAGSSLWYGVSLYALLQSVVLFASVYFRRIAALKTILAVAALLILYTLFVVAIVLLQGRDMSFIDSYLMLPKGMREIVKYCGRIALYAVAPFFWWLGWLRLKETEC